MSDGYAIYPCLRGRTVLITGGATGIGAAFVARFAEQGARVAFLDVDDAAAETLVEEVGGEAAPVFHHCDVTDLGGLQAAIASVRKRIGPISVLINNAANDVRHHLQDVDAAAFERSVAVNLRHQVFATQAVVADMRRLGGGSIICMGSAGWMQKNADYPLYAMAKAAVSGFVNGMARELGRGHIRINCVVPGWVITEKQRRMWLDAEGEATIRRMQCLPGHLVADDIARMALFLASDDSCMCTGQDFIVDGGWV